MQKREWKKIEDEFDIFSLGLKSDSFSLLISVFQVFNGVRILKILILLQKVHFVKVLGKSVCECFLSVLAKKMLSSKNCLIIAFSESIFRFSFKTFFSSDDFERKTPWWV